MSGISALMKEGSEGSLPPSAAEEHSSEEAGCL